MTRRKKLSLNLITSFGRQVLVLICGFILPKYILLYFGSEINGLIASISNFLGFIVWLELGIGPVIQSNLYKPLAQHDHVQISKIVKSSNKFFRTIAAVFLVYIVVLFFVFPTVIDDTFNFWFTGSLVLIISISTLTEYLFGSTYALLLNADQKVYVQSLFGMVTVILNTGLCVFLMIKGFSIHTVKLVSTGICILRPLFLNFYVSKHYIINKHIILDEEPIKQKWNGFAQHFATSVSGNMDIILLTFFSSLLSVSVYSVFYMIVNGISTTMMTTVSGLESYWGNMLANNEKSALNESFNTVEFFIHAGTIFIFTCAAILIVPFVNVYIQGVDSAGAYNVPEFGILLAASHCVLCLRIPYFRVIKAAGQYKETQLGSFILAGINIIVSVLLVFKYDILGVAVGTLLSYLYHMVYLALYIRKNILNRDFSYFVKHIGVDALVIAITVLLTRNIALSELSYIAWVWMAVKVSIIALCATIVVSIVFYNSEMKHYWHFLVRKIKKIQISTK